MWYSCFTFGFIAGNSQPAPYGDTSHIFISVLGTLSQLWHQIRLAFISGKIDKSSKMHVCRGVLFSHKENKNVLFSGKYIRLKITCWSEMTGNTEPSIPWSPVTLIFGMQREIKGHWKTKELLSNMRWGGLLGEWKKNAS